MSRLDSIEASPKLAIQLWLSKVLAKNHLLLIAT
jgi:hypothetical protein